MWMASFFLFPDPNHFASGRGEISTDPTSQIKEWLKVIFSGHRRTNNVIQDSDLSPPSMQGSAGELAYWCCSKGRGARRCCDPVAEQELGCFPAAEGRQPRRRAAMPAASPARERQDPSWNQFGGSLGTACVQLCCPCPLLSISRRRVGNTGSNSIAS